MGVLQRSFARLLALAAVLGIVSGAVPAAAQTIQVSAHTLSNGMRLLIHEDHDIPNVAMYLFFKVGSRNERPGITGISHFFEHMMFNGARKYGPKQFDIEMEKAGGSNNAYTSRDVTVYTDWFPRPALELMFDMEADRIRYLNLDPKIVESERGVVSSERRQSVDNSNFGTLYEQMNAAAYMAHPYGWPVLGWASDIEAWTLEDLQRHYRMGYAPNNCVVVVTGDVTEKEVLALARKYFEPIPRQEPPPPLRTVEPEQQGERRVTVERPGQLPLIIASFHVPRSSHAGTPALQVLRALLDEGRSSLLYRKLVDGELALSAGADLSFSLDPGQLLITVEVRSGVEPARVEKALWETLEQVAAAGPSEQQVRKAKNQLLAALYRDLKTIAGKANRIGEYEVFLGDYQALNRAGETLEKVTREDVRRAARQYLGARNRTVATLIPVEEGGRQ